jgi:hypothetical protein
MIAEIPALPPSSKRSSLRASSRANQLPITALWANRKFQCLGPFVDLVLVDATAGPFQQSCQVVVSQTASITEIGPPNKFTTAWTSSNSCVEPVPRGQIPDASLRNSAYMPSFEGIFLGACDPLSFGFVSEPKFKITYFCCVFRLLPQFDLLNSHFLY